jgi:hypothetical protein
VGPNYGKVVFLVVPLAEVPVNSINLDIDGHIIAGTPDEIRKINRQTGDVMWTLGGGANEFSFVDGDVSHFGGHGTYRLKNGNSRCTTTLSEQPPRAGRCRLPSLGRRARFSAMIADEIKELIHAEPFRPIRIVLGNEQSFVVAHTDYLMISPDRQTVLLYDQQGRFKIINAQQIRLVEPVQRPSAKKP